MPFVSVAIITQKRFARVNPGTMANLQTGYFFQCLVDFCDQLWYGMSMASSIFSPMGFHLGFYCNLLLVCWFLKEIICAGKIKTNKPIMKVIIYTFKILLIIIFNLVFNHLTLL